MDLDSARLQEHVDQYLGQNDAVGYNRFADFDWAGLPDSLRAHELSELQLRAVETALLVEDHIPSYASEYLRLFSVDSSRTDEEAWSHRQMLHFVFRWVAEEDRHAHLLELYLRHSGRRDPAALTQLLVTEGKKPYAAPHEAPAALFAYTALQEKATQLFYSCLRQAVREPVLRRVLQHLAADEARHCHFFSQIVLDTLREGTPKTLALIREALQQFEMPLAHTLAQYKRKAILMARAADGYDYRDAFDHFARLLKRALAARLNARGTQLADLLQLTQQLSPRLSCDL
jgi:acyl-[acyl-carrier-protein] desaturase